MPPPAQPNTLDGARSAHVAANEAAAWALAQAVTGNHHQSPKRAVVISPGSRSTPLVLAFARMAHAELFVVLDERIAAFVALGLARARGQAAVALCTSGSAGGHYLPALIEAAAAEIPLVLITADRPAELQEVGAPQTTCQTQLFAGHLRARFVLPTPRTGADGAPTWHRMAVQALDAAEGQKPGPVHINAPFAEPLVTSETPKRAFEKDKPPRLVRARIAPPTLSVEDIVELKESLVRAPFGVVACGPILNRTAQPGLDELLVRLARRLGWLLWLDGCSQLRRTSKALAYDLILSAPIANNLPRPRSLVRVGFPLTSKRANTYLACGSGVTCGILLSESTALRDPFGHIDRQLVCDPIDALERLVAALGEASFAQQKEHEAALDAWHAIDRQLATPFLALADDDGPLWEGRALYLAASSLKADSVLQLGSSLAVRDFDALALQIDCEIVCNRGVNGIDGTLSCALGLALSNPQRKVAVVLGELAFLHDVAALQAARQQPCALVIIVINNHGGGIFRGLAIATHDDVFSRYFETPQIADIGALARAMGARHVAVDTAGAIAPAVYAAQAHVEGVSVIEVIIAPDAQARRAAWQKTCYDAIAKTLRDTEL